MERDTEGDFERESAASGGVNAELRVGDDWSGQGSGAGRETAMAHRTTGETNKGKERAAVGGGDGEHGPPVPPKDGANGREKVAKSAGWVGLARSMGREAQRDKELPPLPSSQAPSSTGLKTQATQHASSVAPLAPLPLSTTSRLALAPSFSSDSPQSHSLSSNSLLPQDWLASSQQTTNSLASTDSLAFSSSGLTPLTPASAPTRHRLSLSLPAHPSHHINDQLEVACAAAKVRAERISPADLLAFLNENSPPTPPVNPASEPSITTSSSPPSSPPRSFSLTPPPLLLLDVRPHPSFLSSRLATSLNLAMAALFRARLRAKPLARRRYDVERTVVGGGGRAAVEAWRVGVPGGAVLEGPAPAPAPAQADQGGLPPTPAGVSSTDAPTTALRGPGRLILVYDDAMCEAQGSLSATDAWMALLMLDRSVPLAPGEQDELASSLAGDLAASQGVGLSTSGGLGASGPMSMSAGPCISGVVGSFPPSLSTLPNSALTPPPAALDGQSPSQASTLSQQSSQEGSLPPDTRIAYLAGGLSAFARLPGAARFLVSGEGAGVPDPVADTSELLVEGALDTAMATNNAPQEITQATTEAQDPTQQATPVRPARRMSALSVNTDAARDRADRARAKADRRRSGAPSLGGSRTPVFAALEASPVVDGAGSDMAATEKSEGGVDDFPTVPKSLPRPRGATFSAGMELSLSMPASSSLSSSDDVPERRRPPLRVSISGKRPASSDFVGIRPTSLDGGDGVDEEARGRSSIVGDAGGRPRQRGRNGTNLGVSVPPPIVGRRRGESAAAATGMRSCGLVTPGTTVGLKKWDGEWSKEKDRSGRMPTIHSMAPSEDMGMPGTDRTMEPSASGAFGVSESQGPPPMSESSGLLLVASPDSSCSTTTQFFRTPASLTSSGATGLGTWSKGSAVEEVEENEGSREHITDITDGSQPKSERMATEQAIRVAENDKDQASMRGWSPTTAVGILAPEVDMDWAGKVGRDLDAWAADGMNKDREDENENDGFEMNDGSGGVHDNLDFEADGDPDTDSAPMSASDESAPTSDDDEHGGQPLDLYTCVLENLYIGSDDLPASVDGRARLRGLGVTHVLNVATEVNGVEASAGQGAGALAEEGFVCMKLNVKDNANEDMEKFMRQGIAFIESAHADPSSIVFVHCKMGVSRSATIVIAYLMKAMEWTEAKAFDFLRRRRPGIQPNLGFMITLRNWERELFGKTADMGSMGSRDGLGNAGSKEFLGSTSQLVEAQQVAMVL